MGVIGMGNIGARVADICKLAFQMRVLVHDPFLSDAEITERGGEPCTLDDLMRESDYITLHVPLSEKTRGMIGSREFSLMKSTAYFINTSRGPNIDERALTVALQEGSLAGAALDVWDPEPPLPDNPLVADGQRARDAAHVGPDQAGARGDVGVGGAAVGDHLPRRAPAKARQPGGVASLRRAPHAHRRPAAWRAAAGLAPRD